MWDRRTCVGPADLCGTGFPAGQDRLVSLSHSLGTDSKHNPSLPLHPAARVFARARSGLRPRRPFLDNLRWGHFNRPARRRLKKSVLLHPIAELIAGQPQQGSRLGLVVAGSSQGLADQPLLDNSQVHPVRRQHRYAVHPG